MSKCKLVQFKKLPPLDDMYGETYGYRTSLSPLMIKYMREKFKNFIAKIVKKSSSILDIADGTFKFFCK